NQGSMKRLAVKNDSKSQNRVWILILGNRSNGNRDLEGSGHAHDRGVRPWSDNFEFVNGVAYQPIHVVTIVFARNNSESRRLNQFFWSRRKIGRHECRTLLLTAGGARALKQVSHLYALGSQIALVVRIFGRFDTQLFNDIQTVPFETHHLFWII